MSETAFIIGPIRNKILYLVFDIKMKAFICSWKYQIIGLTLYNNNNGNPEG